MIKRFLLIAGDSYYPEAANGDWVGFFDSYDEAASTISEETDEDFNCSRFRITHKNVIKYADWWEIVDLEEQSALLA